MKIAPQVVYIRAWETLDTPHSVASWANWAEYSQSWALRGAFSLMNPEPLDD